LVLPGDALAVNASVAASPTRPRLTDRRLAFKMLAEMPL